MAGEAPALAPAHRGEDLEVIEMPLADALHAIRQGTIVDAKTIMLLQFVALNRTLENNQ